MRDRTSRPSSAPLRPAKRLALALIGAVLVVAGCLGEAQYTERMEKTLELMRYDQTLATFLGPPEAGRLRQLEIYVRPPLPLTRDQQPMIPVAAGVFDAVETFSGTPEAAGGGGGQPMRLLVVASQKRPPRSSDKKAEPAPNTIQRDRSFEPAVRGMLSAVFGLENAPTASAEAVNARGRSYKRLIFNSGNDTIRCYLYDEGNHNVALVAQIPNALRASTTASKGLDLTLETLAVGNAARAAAEGRLDAASGGAAF